MSTTPAARFRFCPDRRRCLGILGLFLGLLVFGTKPAQAQDDGRFRLRVMLADKVGTPYQTSRPEAFLSEEAVARRRRFQIAVTRRDLPVSPDYLGRLRRAGYRVWMTSKWHNFAILGPGPQGDPAADLLAFDFVTAVDTVRPNLRAKRARAALRQTDTTDLPRPAAPTWQLEQMGLLDLHDRGYTGVGVGIGVADGGFSRIDAIPFYQDAVNESRYAGSRDFIARDGSLSEDDPHGSWVWSIIAHPEMGAAPQADYLLYRTEDVSSEYPVEEMAWIAGLEWADSAGMAVVNTSLSYTTFDDSRYDHTYAELDGRTTLASRAGVWAARRGMMLVTSAGNSARSSWPWIGVPADADSTFTVGAVDASGDLAAFSSRGPAADGALKPDGMARGRNTFFYRPDIKNLQQGSGTSFSAPLIAGGLACLRQAFPDIHPQTILQTLRATAERASDPDTAYGYGLVRFDRAFQALQTYQDSLLDQQPEAFPLQLRYEADGRAQLHLLAPFSQDIELRYYDPSGRTLFRSRRTLYPGETLPALVPLPASISPGLYILAVHTAGRMKIFKLSRAY